MENKEISEAEMICRTIFYSQATNGKAEQSIANGTNLIEQYSIRNTHHNHASFVALVEGNMERCKKELAESVRKMDRQNSEEFKAPYRLQITESEAAINELTDLLNKIK